MKLFSRKKSVEETPDDFWTQRVKLEKIKSKYDYFTKICTGKNVIHFGCTDWPIFVPSTNLHIWLNDICENLSGFDIDVEGIKDLKKHVDKDYYSEFHQLDGKQFDVCLVPETIEHVQNISSFLANIGKISAKKIVITGPNCFAPDHMQRNSSNDTSFTEIVHPDHNCWFSPFTLKNVITKYANLNVDRVFLLEDETMVCCECSAKDA